MYIHVHVHLMCILYIIIHVHVHTAGVTGLPGSNVKLEQAMGSTAVDDSSRKREVRLMKNRYLSIQCLLSPSPL